MKSDTPCLDDVVKAIPVLKEVYGKNSEHFLHIKLFEELLGREGVQLIRSNVCQPSGKYLHRAVYQELVFVSTSPYILRKPSAVLV